MRYKYPVDGSWTLSALSILSLAGLAIGTLGTLLGIGGGFLLIPLLAALYPAWPAESLTSVSLAVIFLNSLSGSIAYARRGRIHYRSGIILLLATLPGAVIGANLTAELSRTIFDPAFGTLMLLLCVFLLIRRRARELPQGTRAADYAQASFSAPLAVTISFFVGIVSTVFGIGGGIIHVPAMIHLLQFPVHVATATSQMVLAGMSFVATAVHLVRGELNEHYGVVLILAPSVIIGAQLGARISHRVAGTWIIRLLALILGFLGVRLILGG